MSVYKIVQKITPLTMTGAAVTSNPIALRSGFLRIVPEQDAYASIFVKAGTELVLKDTAVTQTVVGVTTGTTTVVTLPEGTFSDFSAGDIVELTGIVPAGINTTAATVASVDATNDAGTGGFNRVITLTWNTSSQGAPITTSTGVLRRVTKVAAYGASGKLHITEIQIAGG
jgi:hypothetical protein